MENAEYGCPPEILAAFKSSELPDAGGLGIETLQMSFAEIDDFRPGMAVIPFSLWTARRGGDDIESIVILYMRILMGGIHIRPEQDAGLIPALR